MTKNYRFLTEQLRQNLNPEGKAVSASFSAELSTLAYSDVLVFVRTAMKAVEKEYTQQTRDAGNRAKDHLERELNGVSFAYQGSVMTNTHIRGYSDIDLLTIYEGFYGIGRTEINDILNTPEKRVHFSATSLAKLAAEAAVPNYLGNSIEDLAHLRQECERILSSKYNICDKEKPKSIKITNTALRRDVDVVVANWFDDATSVLNDKGDYRGIQVYDKAARQRCPADYPFTSIDRINTRGLETNGRFKKMIRFLKNCKARSDLDIKLSSFDINAICYNIDPALYSHLIFHQLVPVLCNQLALLAINQTLADNLKSIDGREYILRGKSDKIEGVKLLWAEIDAINEDLKKVPKVRSVI
jgi:hypothetical protein